ncbi:MAG: Gldg family protein [Myxococcaceae bacterium]
MILSILIAAGLLLGWIGERIVENPQLRAAFSGTGLLLVIIATVVRVARSNSDKETVRPVHRTFALLHGATLLSLVLYFLQSDLYTRVAGESLATSSPTLSGALSALWPAVLLASLLPTLTMELSFASMARAPKLEDGRMNEARLSGLGVAFAIIFAFSAQYVATERDTKADFSYFRVTKPGDATQKLVASFTEPVEVYLFFPPASDAAELVSDYFKDLQPSSAQLKVTRLDHALEPTKAKELGVSGNGTVLIKMGGRKESLFIGTETEKAKAALRGLDAEVQKRFLQVAKSRRTVYLTGGHGERTQDPANGMDQRATIDVLYKTLQDQNFEVRTLTTAEGLGQEIPKDAAAVFVLGPTRPFTEPEADALVAYEKRGGRLFIALDAEAALPFEELMKPLGLSFKPQNLAQERGNANLRPPPGPADRINIGTRTFSSHPAVTNLGRANAPVLFLGAGGVEELPQHPADLTIDFAVRSLPDAWNDANSNFEFDQQAGETKKAWGVVAAIERRAPSNKPEDAMRVMVMGDSDAIGDVVLTQLPGNQYLVVDGLKWLLGDEQLAGVTNTEVDVPLTRTRQQDTAWFYGTTFFAPLLVIALGFAARRRKPAKKAEVAS